MNRGKDVYDRIEIPAELSERVNKAISSVNKKEADRKAEMKQKNRKIIAFVRSTGVLAATFLICLTVGVNSSQVLASGIGSLPLIGPLARVLTVRSYEEHSGDVDLQAQVPEIQMTSATGEDGGGDIALGAGREEFALTEGGQEPVAASYVTDINQEIDIIVEDFIEKAKQDMADYREAFFQTGGTEEEWADRTMDVNVSYEVKYQEGAWLSLVLHVDECWVSSYQENYYYNLDLENQRDITLQDILGADYINICNAGIISQIEEQVSTDEEKMYFGYGPYADELNEDMKFTTITPETDFYINENGNVVICFEKYEIAPGYMGVCEFEIMR